LSTDYLQLAADVTRKARDRGADECDCLIEVGTELTIRVRSGEVESIERASFAGMGIRFFKKKSLGFGFTTDFSAASIDGLIDRSKAFAETSTPDPDAGVPEFGPMDNVDLEINDPTLRETPLAEKTGMALACEKAAYDLDKRIKYTYGTSYGDVRGTVILARSGTDPIHYDATHVDLTCIPVAEQSGERRMGIWLTSERFLSDLESPAAVGTRAAQQAVDMIGAKTVPTQKAGVVFDSRTGGEVVAEIFRALDGENVLRGMSFLKGRLGEKVGSEWATFVDDGRMPRRTGSRPFDAEGMPTQRTLAIDKGTLKSYFYDSRSARKCGTESTANARRGFSSIPEIGANNFYLIPGKESRDEVIASVKKGILVTRLLGFGVNVTTGDYSRGAEGLWIEDGKITHPVDGITVAGNLLGMLGGMKAVASDLRFFGRMGSPTFVIDEMTIAGS
jgi:PmbA protein